LVASLSVVNIFLICKFFKDVGVVVKVAFGRMTILFILGGRVLRPVLPGETQEKRKSRKDLNQ